MNWSINKIILIVLTIYALSVRCQNVDDATSIHNYDVSKSVKKYAENINLSKSLKLISEEDKIFLNGFQDFLPHAIHPILLEMLSQTTSDKCVQDIQYAFKRLLPPSDWSMKMVDSFGKPESGILLGNFKWLGEYDECLKIYAPPKGKTGLGDFHGKYCTVQIPLKLGSMALPLSTAVCLPDSCNPNATFNGLFNSLQTNLTGMTQFNLAGMDEKMESILSNATISCKSKPKELTTGAIVVITFLSVITFLAVIGSSITVLERYLKRETVTGCNAATSEKSSLNGDVETASHDDVSLIGAKSDARLPTWLEKCKPFFNCFCIFTNGEKILNTASAEGQLPCLHGIRFLSMTWVIVCHCYMSVANAVKNPLEAIDYVDNWTFQIIMNGFFSVDSFFVLSGFLVGYLYFQHAPKTNGKIPWFYFYIHRYIRLTPVYVIVMLFFTFISPFMGSGPLWPEYTVVQACKDYWWWNLLYINNFQNMSDECMGWSWYLANDMQFYIISPLFLITLYRWPKIGYSLLGLFFCISFTANFAITYEYNLVAGMGNILEYYQDLQTYLPRMMDFFNKVYIKPYTRVGAYLVGLLVAYIVCKRKQNNSPKLNTITLWVGWTLASGVALACQFGLYHHKLSLVATSFYNALSRIGFSLGLGWVIFVCVIGQGDAVNSILSWKALIPLSRLTYCAYLVHPVVQTIYFGSIRQLIEFNHINVIMLYFGTLFISYAAALVTSLLFESPVIRLERLLRNKFSS
ncbi:nose resistant to fluoxetine protein 6-like [Argiope bruennichi]|uniref:nose resistant to fluoxetine protein 6-like n=1 Tax=Argiope bruennichi TaxID=94029 RepID=UPI002493FC94|nr:nose resistant to fluoxetine protein 6-like [Argiope bruennichi]